MTMKKWAVLASWILMFALTGRLAAQDKAKTPAVKVDQAQVGGGHVGSKAIVADVQPGTLTEVQQLRGVVLRLQIENEQLRRQLADANLRALGPLASNLEKEYLESTKAPAGSGWDWATMTPMAPKVQDGKPPTP